MNPIFGHNLHRLLLISFQRCRLSRFFFRSLVFVCLLPLLVFFQMHLYFSLYRLFIYLFILLQFFSVFV